MLSPSLLLPSRRDVSVDCRIVGDRHNQSRDCSPFGNVDLPVSFLEAYILSAKTEEYEQINIKKILI